MRAIRPSVGPSRVDARRNRDAILRVAGEAFAEGVDVVGLDEIARRAGLGRATVYRHFPDRGALATAVAAKHLDALRTLDDRNCPEHSFPDLLRIVLTMQIEFRPLVGVFRELPAHHQQQFVDALLTVLRPAFDEAQREGLLRRDLQLTDLLLVFEMVEAALASGPATMDRLEPTQRLVEVLVDGLRTPHPPQ
jgi:AcrR family transcriptional regulator